MCYKIESAEWNGYDIRNHVGTVHAANAFEVFAKFFGEQPVAMTLEKSFLMPFSMACGRKGFDEVWLTPLPCSQLV